MTTLDAGMIILAVGSMMGGVAIMNFWDVFTGDEDGAIGIFTAGAEAAVATLLVIVGIELIKSAFKVTIGYI